MAELDAPVLRLLLAAPPEAPGADALYERVRSRTAEQPGASLLVMLSGPGLAWMRDDRLRTLARGDGVEIALCSQSARAQGEDPDAIPPWIRWSSLVAWFRELDVRASLWSLLP